MSGSIIVHALLWLLCAAAGAISWIFSKSLWAAAVFFFLLLLPPVNVLWNLLQRRRVRIHLEVPQSAEKNQELTGIVQISSGNLAPIGKVWITLSVQNNLTGECAKLTLSAVPNTDTAFSLQTQHCGRLHLSAERLRLMDLFGFLPVRCKAGAQAHLTVMPESFPLEISAIQQMARTQDSENYRSDCKGDDMTETFQLREYVPGDNLHGIHWKLSSKIGKLVYKEPAMPEDHSLLLCWDQAEGSPEVYDALAESVFSVGQALCEAGKSFTLGWMEECEFCTAEIDGIDELAKHLPALLKGSGRNQPLPDLSDFGCILLFTGSIPQNNNASAHIFYCGNQTLSGATSFTAKTYREILQRLDVGYEN